jgi:hypothetical protein
MQFLYTKCADMEKEDELIQLCVKIRVGFAVFDCAKRKGKRVKSYNGVQCVQILNNLERFADLIGSTNAAKVWVEWRWRYNCLKKGILQNQKGETVTAADWTRSARQMGKNWIKVHGADTVRIYVHIMIYHGADLVLQWGPLQFWSQQGFENANCFHGRLASHHSDHNKSLYKRKQRSENGENVVNDETPTTLEQIVFLSLAKHSHTCTPFSKKPKKNNLPIRVGYQDIPNAYI